MNIGSISPSGLTASLANSALSPEMAIHAMKQAQDQAKQEGEALVKMINATPAPSPTNGRIDIYA